MPHGEDSDPVGTTSAYAENTEAVDSAKCGHGNYLRVRGEYPYSAISAASMAELPPRTRRILEGEKMYTAEQGTTSACAENTGNP